MANILHVEKTVKPMFFAEGESSPTVFHITTFIKVFKVGK